MISRFRRSLEGLAWHAANVVTAPVPPALLARVANTLDATSRGVADQGSLLARALGGAASRLMTRATSRRLAHVETAVKEGAFQRAVQLYREAVAAQPTASLAYSPQVRLAKSGELGDAFSRAAIDAIENAELRRMMCALMNAPAIYHPSRQWLYYLVYNAFQLDTAGIEHFKQTVNNNYFNWTSASDVELQVRSLQATLGISDADLEALDRSIDAPPQHRPAWITPAGWKAYSRLLALLWERAARIDDLGLLRTCTEPDAGDPIAIRFRGRVVTQDLCNSVIDVNTIAAGAPGGLSGPLRIAELGAGHGRIENILLRANPGLRVTVIDIPPALFVSQWYLRTVFPEKKLFRFREFEHFDEVREEFEAADIAILAPHQVEALPGKIFDGFINICSLQEMTHPQIANWFRQVDRLCRGWFFTKQYKESVNQLDDIVVRRGDYPVGPGWSVVFDRDNPQNSSLFEAMYAIDRRAAAVERGA